MPFAAALSTLPSAAEAFQEVGRQLAEQQGGPADLALAFFSPHHASAADKLVQGLQTQLQPKCLLGCVAESVVGNDQEIEETPALAAWVARWKTPVAMEPFHLSLERTSEGLSLLGWPDALVESDPGKSAILLLGDPFSLRVD